MVSFLVYYSYDVSLVWERVGNDNKGSIINGEDWV